VPKYSGIEYPLDETGENDYPQRLANYLCKRFFHGGTLLDVGSGKGNYLMPFFRCGVLAAGLDKETGCDLEKDKFKFKSNSLDYIFSKSTLEHIHNWEHVLSECYRVLKPEGLAVFLVPDWNSQKWKFFDDPTHVKPYTKKSLEMAFKLVGFKDVHCEYFNLHKFKTHNKLPAWMLYLREKMLLCYAMKSSHN